MPNCDFYALSDDAAGLLAFVFGDTGCRVYEMASEPGQPLRQFQSVEQVLAAFELGVARAGVHLQLYSPAMGGTFHIKRIDFDPRRVKGPLYRYDGHGWGAIQLYFGGLRDGRIAASHTSHNSEKRARAWEATAAADLGPVDAWHWREVVRISRAINRHISKHALGKHGSRPILPAAWSALQVGGVTCG